MTSYSAVPSIQLNKDGSITLEVEVYGFEEGKAVEIFGQASQTNGAVAPFYKVVTMPKPDEAEKSATITLDQIPRITGKPFDVGRHITVVARAAEAWVTILSHRQFASAETSIGSGEFQARWEGG